MASPMELYQYLAIKMAFAELDAAGASFVEWVELGSGDSGDIDTCDSDSDLIKDNISESMVTHLVNDFMSGYEINDGGRGEFRFAKTASGEWVMEHGLRVDYIFE